jgi:nifR3 family TIM-barrel protein
VTLKFRMGIDDDHLTYRTSGAIGEEEGCAAVGLHARTAADLYDGEARWDAIADLKSRVRIPVLGNGDIWEAEDALRMMRTTGCDGVIVGRGCLGRPWLFRDLADLFDGREPSDPPALGEVVRILLEHARLLAEWMSEEHAVRAFRRQATWYTKGFRGSAEARRRAMEATTLAGLRAALEPMDRSEPFPPSAMRVPRGKTAGTRRVSLPDGWLDRPEDDAPPEGAAEDAFSGG